MRRIFASLQNPAKYGYVFDSEGWDTNSTVDHHFRLFETLGDGMTAHSHDRGITVSVLTDYLLSLADKLYQEPVNAEDSLYDTVRYTINNRPAEADIAFCATVVFRQAEDSTYTHEKRTRYFSVAEKKISSAPAKQYDKRYAKVEDWHNGSPEAAYRMLIREFPKAFEQLAYAEAIRDWYESQPDYSSSRHYMGLPGQFLKWRDCEEHQAARMLHQAYRALQDICESKRLYHATDNAIQNAKRAIERETEQAA